MVNPVRWASILVVGLAGCQSSAAPGGLGTSEVEAATAAVDVILDSVFAGAARVDADAVLRPAVDVDSLTMIIGDVILGGYEPILERFRETYAGLERQDQTLVEKHVRVLSPDVVLVEVIGQGTYTDLAGWTSDPVGIGLTVVFIRQAGQWRVTHVHQSIVD